LNAGVGVSLLMKFIPLLDESIVVNKGFLSFFFSEQENKTIENARNNRQFINPYFLVLMPALI
jgi:hypothetical protein